MMENIDCRHLLMLIMIPAMLVSGCKSGNRGAPARIDDGWSEKREGEAEPFSRIYHLYPSPAEMLSIIDMAEMNFDGQLLFPVTKADQYLDTKSRTHMLGIYMADLAYAALFGRHEATLDYLEVVRSLAGEIRIDQAVDEKMIRKARNNVEYLDSLYTISNEAFMGILDFCERNERLNTVVMLSAGAFTESLYLAANLVDDYQEADYLLQHLADQKYTIDNFMSFAESVGKDDRNVASTIDDLKRIRQIYENIDPGSGEVIVSASKDPVNELSKKLVIGSGGEQSQPSMTRQEFEELKAAVIELRTKIVES